MARRPPIRYDTLPDAQADRFLPPKAISSESARTQALLRPIAPGKVTASFAPLGRVLFWELFCALIKLLARSSRGARALFAIYFAADEREFSAEYHTN